MVFELELDPKCEDELANAEPNLISLRFDDLLNSPNQDTCLIEVTWRSKRKSGTNLDYRQMYRYEPEALLHPSLGGKKPFLVIVTLDRILPGAEDIFMVEWYKGDDGNIKPIINGVDRRALAIWLYNGRMAREMGAFPVSRRVVMDSRDDLIHNMLVAMEWCGYSKWYAECVEESLLVRDKIEASDRYTRAFVTRAVFSGPIKEELSRHIYLGIEPDMNLKNIWKYFLELWRKRKFEVLACKTESRVVGH
ncbi:hypothetical protein KEM54_001487 [Ascosphaera aggregata]|nr:hypothetical protein KEM54_001487 [Ascosphaera aggregata]